MCGMPKRLGQVVMLVAVIVLGVTAYWFATRGRTQKPTTPVAPVSAEIHRPAGVVKTGAATTKGEQLHSDVGTLQLEGQVVDEQLQPVAGAQVTLLLDVPRKVTTEADGAYSFSNLAPGPYRLIAHKDAMSSDIARARLSKTSDPVTLRVRPGATVAVTVIAADTGAPVAGATVADRARSLLTGSDGIAKLGGMGEYDMINITAPGFSPESFMLDKPEDPLGTIERIVKLARGAAIAGTVVGPDGALIADATVSVEGAATGWVGSATTDAKGAWTIPVLAADKYAVTATSEIYAAAAPITIELDGKTPRAGVVVRVEVGAQLVGTVVDAKGHPVAGAKVTLANNESDSFDDTTGADGRFSFLGTPAGAFWVWATTATQGSSRIEVQLVRDQRVEVHLILADSSLAGIVVDSKGEPVAEAVIDARSRLMIMDRLRDERTDAKGAFDFGGVPPGEYELVAARAEQNDARRLDGTKVIAPDRNVKLVLPDVSSITGRVMLDGKPMTYFGLIVTDHPEFSWQDSPLAVRSPEGRFTHTGVAPGTWGVVVGGPGVARKVIEGVVVTEGKVTDLGDITLDHGQRIRGRVTTKDGTAVAGATVAVGEGIAFRAETPLKLSMQGNISTVTDATGTYQIAGILKTARKNEIVATHPSLGSSGTRAVLPKETTIDLVIVPVGGIDGTVVGATERARLVNAQLVTGDKTRFTAQVDSTGVFALDNLIPGDYDVKLFGAPGRATPAPLRVTVVANKRTPATITIPANTITLAIHYAADCQMVMLKPPGETRERLASAMCDDKGNAVIEGLEPGTYSVCATFESCVPVTIAPTPARQTVEIPVSK